MEKNNIWERKGKIQITPQLLQKSDPLMLSKLFSKIYPLFIDDRMGYLNNLNNPLIYLCISEKFDIVPEATVIPHYNCIIEPIYDDNQMMNYLNPVAIDYKITFTRLKAGEEIPSL